MTKKTIINKLREFGIKATYQNICWCKNKDFEIVGGILYASSNQDIYFKVENKIVSLVKDFSEIKPLILA